MEKAKKIFLYIGTAVVIISFIFFAVVFIMDTLNEIEFNRDRDILGKGDEWLWAGVNFLAVPVPILLTEIFIIKDSCILLSSNESKPRKALSIISAVLSVYVIVMAVLLLIGIVDFNYQEIVLLSLLVALIASFILSFKIKV